MPGNVLGQPTAEDDSLMLKSAFYESAAFAQLKTDIDKQVVVGRRGSGKSALFLRLKEEIKKSQNTRLVDVVPAEDQVIGLRENMSGFGDDYHRVRAAANIAWRYALLADIATTIANNYRTSKSAEAPTLRKHVTSWTNASNTSGRLRKKLEAVVNTSFSAEKRIASLGEWLEVDELQSSVRDVISTTGLNVWLLLDSLDEGYEPDAVGSGMIGGLLLAVGALGNSMPNCRCITFLRDALYRSLRSQDKDFSRNIEPKVIRLSWNDRSLLDMVGNRLKVAFPIGNCTPLEAWEQCVSDGLHHMDGFRKCLSLTLYRPRDLIGLLNQAFSAALQKKSNKIAISDIESSAAEISKERQEDLVKEYRDVIPGLSRFMLALGNGGARLRYVKACEILSSLFADVHEPRVQQDLEAIGSADEIVSVLYGTGVLGVRDEATGSFVFSHDGKSNGRTMDDRTELLIHPSYWKALNINADPLKAEDAQEIHDEYDPEVSAESGQLRNKNISVLISKLASIRAGDEGDKEFEEWCLRAVKLVFAGHVRNCELHPNKLASTRRDIVGRNAGERNPWRRLLAEYRVEQVIFEVKNYERPTIEDFAQLLSYSGKPYGKAGFFITRGDQNELKKNSTELNQIQHLWNQHRYLAIILPSEWFARVLAKLRNPAKNDYGNDQLDKLIDLYQRSYILGQGAARKKSSKKNDGD